MHLQIEFIVTALNRKESLETLNDLTSFKLRTGIQ